MTTFYGETLGRPFVKRYGSRRDTSDSGLCRQAICSDPVDNPLSLHHRCAPQDERPAAQ